VELLGDIEGLAFVRLLKASFLAYPVVNAIHIAAIGGLFTSVLLMDVSVLGGVRTVPREKLVRLMRRVAFLAFAISLPSGLALFSVRATHYAGNPAFLVKLGLIGLAVLNFLAFAALARKGYDDEPSLAAKLCAVVSILLWSGVLLAGRFIGFI